MHSMSNNSETCQVGIAEKDRKRKRLTVKVPSASIEPKEPKDAQTLEVDCEDLPTPIVDTNPFCTNFGATLLFFHQLEEIEALYDSGDEGLNLNSQQSEKANAEETTAKKPKLKSKPSI